MDFEKQMRPSDFEIRLLRADDSIEELTRLLNRAYKVLAEMGFRYVATWQGPDITRERVQKGECWLAIGDEGAIVGTIGLYPPAPDDLAAHYRQPGVFSFGQFAIEPALQRTGLGSRMLDHVEKRARELGAQELALDTSEGAHHLIRYYEKRGYEFVEWVQWKETNYRSVIMSKRLG
jgi:GNAT superfamily N-acetyltransferase